MPEEWGDCVNSEGVAGIKCLEVVFANLIRVLVLLVPISILVMFIIGGFKWLTSGGEPKQIESAQKTIFFAVVGVVLMILSYIIMLAIKWFTGIDVLEFSIPIS